MIKEKYKTYAIPVVLIAVYILIRAIWLFGSNSIYETDFKGLAVARSFFPFGIIKQCAIKEYFMPLYYILLSALTFINKSAIFAKIINCIISFVNILVFYNLGRYISTKKTGLLLALFVTINHFFIFYTNLIAPYCLNFLIGTLLIYSILQFCDKPDKKNFLKLSLFNCLLILSDSFGAIYVGIELIVLYLKNSRPNNKKYFQALFAHSLIALIVAFPILLIELKHYTTLLIPETIDGVGLNFTSLYLLLNDYFSPFLSFCTPDTQKTSTMGMLYSLFLTGDAKNINTFKIILTLFLGSILPLISALILSIRANILNSKFRIITLIALLDLIVILFFSLIGKIEVHPIFTIQFFITAMILVVYAISTIEDKLIRILIITCLFTIQFINPKIDIFNITIKRCFTTVSAFNYFLKEYYVDKNDIVIMPYMGNYAKLYYKKLNIYNFNYDSLKSANKEGIIRYVNNKRADKINSQNVFYLMSDYLKETKLNSYLTKKFLDDFVEKDLTKKRVILFIDKVNTRPISTDSIKGIAQIDEYDTQIRKINLKDLSSLKNHQKMFYDALKSKTLYTYLTLLEGNYTNRTVIEYKNSSKKLLKMESKIKSTLNAINSPNSDYVIIIYSNK